MKMNLDSGELLRMAFAKMTPEQLVATREKLHEQLGVIDALIAERKQEV